MSGRGPTAPDDDDMLDAPVRPSATASPAPLSGRPPMQDRARLVDPDDDASEAGSPPAPVPRIPLASAPDVSADPGYSEEPSEDGPAPVGRAPAIVAQPSLRAAPGPRGPALAGTPAGVAVAKGPNTPVLRSSPAVMVSPSTFPPSRELQAVPPIRIPEPAGWAQPAYQHPGPASPRTQGARQVDTPVASDLFVEGGFEELAAGGVPFDERPAQVMEDVGQPYTTVFTVGDPPPLPGIADRFTPPPSQPTEIGSRRVRAEASASPTPDRKERFEPTPAPVRRSAAPRLAAPSPTPMVVSEPQANNRWMWFGIVGIGSGVVGLVAMAAAVVLVYGGSGGAKGDPEEPPVASRPRAPEEEPRPAPEGSANPAAPTPTPRPGAATAPVEVAAVPATTATLKVRANRRAIVYLDEQAIGYTPVSYQSSPGKHALSAMMPGQPNSRQAREVTLPAPGETIAVEFTF